MRSMGLPANSSRTVRTIGMAPATAASKLSAPPFFSASVASLKPCLASKALLAVTTDLPDDSAASTAALAGSPAPPISSTNTSMPGSRASATGSSNHFIFLRSTPRSLFFERAETATTSMRRPPQRMASRSRSRTIWAMRAAPTVPRPATPTFRDCDIFLNLASGGERHHVVELGGRSLEEATDVARGLADALLVLHERNAHEALAALAE